MGQTAMPPGAGMSPRSVHRLPGALAWLAVFSATLHVIFIFRARFEHDGHTFFGLFDDAMISMSYARNLARGAGLVWNPGELPVEGYTNFLWTLWMALIHWLGADPRYAGLFVALSSSAAIVGTLGLAHKLVTRAGYPAQSGTAAALMITGSYGLTYWSLRGQTAAIALLILACIFLYETAQASTRLSVWAPLCAVSACIPLVRPDGIVVPIGLTLAWLATARTGRSRTILPLVAVWISAGAAMAAHTFFRIQYYGDWLPNTYYLKMTGVAPETRIMRGTEYLLLEAMLCLSPLLLHFALPRDVRANLLDRLGPLYGVVAAQFSYFAYSGGDAWEWMMHANRFLASVWPLVACMFAVLIWALLEYRNKRTVLAWLAVTAVPPLSPTHRAG